MTGASSSRWVTVFRLECSPAAAGSCEDRVQTLFVGAHQNLHMRFMDFTVFEGTEVDVSKSGAEG